MDRLADFVVEALSGGEAPRQVVAGWMESEPRARVADVLRSVKPRMAAETFQTLLLQAPFASDVWQLPVGDATLAKAY